MLCCDDVVVAVVDDDDDDDGGGGSSGSILMVDEFASESHRSIFVFILGLLIHVFHRRFSRFCITSFVLEATPYKMSKFSSAKKQEQEN